MKAECSQREQERKLRMLRARLASNENKMSDGGRGRALIAVEMAKSFQKWSGQRSAVRSIVWLDASRVILKGGLWS
jgi:hypothetical protein